MNSARRQHGFFGSCVLLCYPTQTKRRKWQLERCFEKVHVRQWRNSAGETMESYEHE